MNSTGEAFHPKHLPHIFPRTNKTLPLSILTSCCESFRPLDKHSIFVSCWTHDQLKEASLSSFFSLLRLSCNMLVYSSYVDLMTTESPALVDILPKSRSTLSSLDFQIFTDPAFNS